MADELVDIRERLVRIETKLDFLVPVEARLRVVENHQSHAAGRSGVISVFAATVTSGLVALMVRLYGHA